MVLNKPVVGMAATPDGGGYWLVASDGGIFSSATPASTARPGAWTSTSRWSAWPPPPAAGGYWLVASDGGIFSFGDAPSTVDGRHPLNKPVVGMAATPDGKGYWLVASDGGIFAFGDAEFYGCTGSLVLNKPIVGMIGGPGRRRLLARGLRRRHIQLRPAPFYGSLGGLPPQDPIVAAAATPTGNGYWFTDTTGLVSNFGTAGYYGSAPQVL